MVYVCLCSCLLAATYFIEILCHGVLYGIFQICNMFLLKMLRSKVLVSFADQCCLPHSLISTRWTNETAVAFFQLKGCVSDSTYNMTNSSLIHSTLADKLLGFLHGTRCTAMYYVTACSVHSFGYSSSYSMLFANHKLYSMYVAASTALACKLSSVHRGFCIIVYTSLLIIRL